MNNLDQTPTESSISGPSLLCTSENYSINNIPSGATITWSSSSNISRVSSQGSNPCTFEKYSNGKGTINASITSDCENYNISYEVHTGPYSSSDYEISGPSEAECESYVYYSIPQLEGATTIDWSWPEEFSYGSGQGTEYLELYTSIYGGYVSVGVDNTCGQHGSYARLYTYVSGYCGYQLDISPNPAIEIVNVAIIEPESLKSKNISSDYKVSIIDKSGILHYNSIKKEKKFSIPIYNLKNGDYFINVVIGKLNLSGKLIVNH